MSEPQNYQNHVKQAPAWVNGVYLIFLLNILWSGYRLFSGLSVDSVLAFLVSIALVLLGFISRTQTLTVQNRLIRLEQRLRYRELLPADVAARAAALPVSQIVALRFAGDAELPALVNEVLSGQLSDPKAIKLKVKDWQADHLRA
jgi:hypothetical protein